VHGHEESACLEKFAKSKTVNSILITIDEKLGIGMEKLYETIVWPLYKHYSHPLEAYRIALNDEKILNSLKNAQQNVKEKLMEEI